MRTNSRIRIKDCSIVMTTSSDTRFGYCACNDDKNLLTRVKSPSRNSCRMVSTADRKVCSPPKKVVLSGREVDVGLEARLYVRLADGERRMSKANPRRWKALVESGWKGSLSG